MIISEDYMIKEIMSESKEALSSGEISKKIYEKFKHRITKTTVKNYLWSSLRPFVHCNTEDWVYSLKKESEMLSTSSVFKVSTHPVNDLPDYLRIQVLGDEVNCTYRDNLTVDEVIKALIELELANDLRKEALKKLNIRIKLNRIDNDIE
jgi:hypothetical protein